MELIGLYYGTVSAVQEIQLLYGSGVAIPDIFLYGLIGVAMWAALFILQGFGLRAIANRRGIQKTWRAFVPFVNVLLMGELAGTCSFFGKPVKRAGLLAMIFQIIATLVLGTQMVAQVYLYVAHGVPAVVNGMEVWQGLKGFSWTVFQVYNVLYYFASLAQILCEIMFFILLIGLYKNYNYKNHMIFGFLGLLVPVSRMIIIFVLRKNKYINYDDMMRARREAYIRQQQQYQNQYGQGGFGYNGYDAPRAPQQPVDNDPFEEFGGDSDGANTNNNDDPFEDIFS